MKSANITATDGRVLSAFSPVIKSVVESKIDKKIKSEVDKLTRNIRNKHVKIPDISSYFLFCRKHLWSSIRPSLTSAT